MLNKKKMPLSLPLCTLALMLVLIVFILQIAGCGESGSTDSAVQGGWSSDASSSSTGPQVESAVNMNNPGQALGTGDWLQINGSNFGSTQGSSYVTFSNGSDINARADTYSQWSDTQVICRVPLTLKGKVVANCLNQRICAQAGAENGTLVRELASILFSSPEMLACDAGSGFKPNKRPAVTVFPPSHQILNTEGRHVANLGGPMLLPMLVVGGVAAAIVNATVNSNQHNADPQPTPPLPSPSPSASPSISPSPSPTPTVSPSPSTSPSPSYSPTPGGGGGGGTPASQWWNMGTAPTASPSPSPSMSTFPYAAPQVKVNSAGVPYVAFGNGDTGDSAIYVGTFSSSGWNELPLPTPSPSPSDTPSPVSGFNPALYLDGTVPYIAYYTQSTTSLTVCRYDTGSGTWGIVATEAVAAGIGDLKNMSLYVNGSSTATPSIYVAYQADYSDHTHSYVRTVNATSFVTIKDWTDALSPSLHGYGSTPYIAYVDTSTPTPTPTPSLTPSVAVQYYGGSNWTSCGTIASATYPKIYVTSQGGTVYPYCAYFDAGSTTHVAKYASGSWTELGSGITVSSGKGNHDHALAVNNSIPYAALVGNGASSYAVAVKKYTGAAWADVGSPSISANTCDSNAGLDVYSGIPYVAFTDQTSNLVTLWKYATSKNMSYLNRNLFLEDLPNGIPSALWP